jgi:hypothetical protein
MIVEEYHAAMTVSKWRQQDIDEIKGLSDVT